MIARHRGNIVSPLIQVLPAAGRRGAKKKAQTAKRIEKKKRNASEVEGAQVPGPEGEKELLREL